MLRNWNTFRTDWTRPQAHKKCAQCLEDHVTANERRTFGSVSLGVQVVTQMMPQEMRCNVISKTPPWTNTINQLYIYKWFYILIPHLLKDLIMAIYHALVCCQNIDLIRRLGLNFFTEIHNWQHLSDTCPTADETFQLSSAKSAE